MSAAYYRAHRDELLGRARARRVLNRGTIRLRASAYYQTNKDTILQRHALWRKSNPEAVRIYTSRHRARRRGNGGSHTIAEWLDKLELFAHLCVYCGADEKMTVDHNIPIARGGTDDISNIVPACKSCNSRKGDKTAAEFIGLRNGCVPSVLYPSAI